MRITISFILLSWMVQSSCVYGARKEKQMSELSGKTTPIPYEMINSNVGFTGRKSHGAELIILYSQEALDRQMLARKSYGDIPTFHLDWKKHVLLWACYSQSSGMYQTEVQAFVQSGKTVILTLQLKDVGGGGYDVITQNSVLISAPRELFESDTTDVQFITDAGKGSIIRDR